MMGSSQEPVSIPDIELRDWFAGQALSGLVSGTLLAQGVAFDKDYVATDAYLYADAMLKARKDTEAENRRQAMADLLNRQMEPPDA